MQKAELTDFYRQYNQRCNEHRFTELGEFVADDVVANGEPDGLRGYVSGLQAVVEAFPDYRWDLQRLLVDPPWICAHFRNSGTHRGAFEGIPATGRPVSTQEFALYRVDAGKIVEVWVTADDLALVKQIR
ncbi:ester cyclase [Actinomycetes bacterium KLBMP 9759]